MQHDVQLHCQHLALHARCSVPEEWTCYHSVSYAELQTVLELVVLTYAQYLFYNIQHAAGPAQYCQTASSGAIRMHCCDSFVSQ